MVLGDSPLGAWSFKARPNARGLLFSDLDLDLRGLKVTGSAGWEGTAESSASWYKGRLEGRNLADVLTAWNFAPSATSERFRLDADGRSEDSHIVHGIPPVDPHFHQYVATRLGRMRVVPPVGLG